MADTTTPSLGLVKMGVGSHRDSWGDIANGNLDKIDVAVKAAADTAGGALPKAGGSVTGEIIRSAAGAHPHFADAALSTGTIFLTPAAAPSPLTAPGQIWLGYSA